jgi:hypothetical protein
MKMSPKTIAVSVLVLFGGLASGSAMAQHYGHGGNVRFGLSIGVPLYGPGYYPAPYYPAPYYTYPAYAYPMPAYGYPPAAVSSPPVYIEQGAPPAASASAPAQPQGEWYYCADSKAYYPYVRECPAGWQRVPAQPPSR